MIFLKFKTLDGETRTLNIARNELAADDDPKSFRIGGHAVDANTYFKAMEQIKRRSELIELA